MLLVTHEEMIYFRALVSQEAQRSMGTGILLHTDVTELCLNYLSMASTSVRLVLRLSQGVC